MTESSHCCSTSINALLKQENTTRQFSNIFEKNLHRNLQVAVIQCNGIKGWDTVVKFKFSKNLDSYSLKLWLEYFDLNKIMTDFFKFKPFKAANYKFFKNFLGKNLKINFLKSNINVSLTRVNVNLKSNKAYELKIF
jgi:hypothetical protein